MNKIILTIISLLLCSCSIVPKCPEGTRVIIKGEYPVIITPDSLQWSIVPYREFENYCWKHHLGYIGSYSDYHLFRWWSKVIPFKGAESEFAVPKSEWTPDSLYNYELHIQRQLSPQSEINTRK